MEKRKTNYGDGYFDESVSLTWLKYDKHSSDLDYIMMMNKIDQQVDQWSQDKKVNEFVTYGRSLPAMLHAILGELNNMYYAYDEEKDEILGLVFMCNATKEYPYSVIEYIVTNPKYMNMGIGTRMVSSIKQNPEFFTGNEHQGKFLAFVKHDNKSSKKIMLKNKFRVLKKPASIIAGIYSCMYDQLYYDESENKK